MRAILYPTFPCRKISLSRPDAFLLPPRWVSRLPLIRSSVRTGHLPRGKALGRRSGAETFFQKCFFSIFLLENASKIGFRISVVIAPPPYQIQRSQKPASGNERLKKRGPGAKPRPSFSPFLGEKWGPRWAGGPRGAAPRGLVTAPTTRRVRTTGDSGPAPVQGCGAAVPNGTTCRQQRPPAPPGAPTPTRRVRSTPQERSASHA